MATSTSTALVHLDEHAHWLVRGSLSDPAPGRTLHQAYLHIGHLVGTQANRAAHRFGRGPFATADRIAELFGTGQQREAKLNELQAGGCPLLAKECFKLMKYALPCETARTQVETFKCIVAIATRYHGTRALFLKSKHLRPAGNTAALICAVWVREDDTQTREWDYHCRFAVACLSEKDTCSILGNLSPGCLGCLGTGNGNLSVIERLLIASECSVSSTPDALAQRYLTGILELPTFWEESGPIHIIVFSKILDRVIRLLTDLGLESDEDSDKNNIIFDSDGVDFLATAVLIGVLGWNSADPESQYWYRSFVEIVRLLQRPQAESLLPGSSTLATSPDIDNILSGTAPQTLDVLIMANDDTQMPQTHDDHISLRSIGEVLNDPIHDLGFAPKVVYTAKSASLRWTTLATDFFRARRFSLGLNNTAKAPQSASKARTRISRRLRGFLSRHRSHDAESLETPIPDTPTTSTSGGSSVHDEEDVSGKEDTSERQAHSLDRMLIQMSSDHDSEDERHSKLNEVPGENLTTEEMRSPHAPDRHLDKDAWATNQEYDNEHHDEGVESAEIKSEGHEYYDENGAIETSLLSRGVFDEFRLWEKPPKLANRLDKHSIFSASTNSANGLDVVLPGGAMIRSSQDGENELRYSYVEPDGDTYDISDIVDDDVLEGVLGPDKALLGEKMDRLLYKIQSRRHQPTFSPLREEEQASDNDLDDGPESEYEPGTSYNRRSPLTKSRNALNGRVVLKTPGSPWCPVAVNQPIRFRSSVSNKSMDYDYHNGMGPLNLQQYRTNHHANQKFEIQSVGPKGFCIRHVASGRYLTTGNTGDRRVNMEVGNFPTLFTFEKLLDDDGGWNGAVQVHLADHNQYTLNVEGASQHNFAPLIGWSGDKGVCDRWYIENFDW